MSIGIQRHFSQTEHDSLKPTRIGDKTIEHYREHFPAVSKAFMKRSSSSVPFFLWMGFVTVFFMVIGIVIPYFTGLAFGFDFEIEHISSMFLSSVTYTVVCSWGISRAFMNRTLSALRFFNGLAGLGNFYFLVLFVLLAEFYFGIKPGNGVVLFLGYVLSVASHIWLSNQFVDNMRFCNQAGVALHKRPSIKLPLEHLQFCLQLSNINDVTGIRSLNNDNLKQHYAEAVVYESYYGNTRIIEVFIHCESTLEKWLGVIGIPSPNTWRIFSKSFDCTQEMDVSPTAISTPPLEKYPTVLDEPSTDKIHEAIVEYADEASVPLRSICLLLIYTGMVVIFQFMMTVLTSFLMAPAPTVIFTMMMGLTHYAISQAYVDFAKRLRIRQPVFVAMMIPISCLVNIGFYIIDLPFNVIGIVVATSSLLAMHRTTRLLKQQFYCEHTETPLELMVSRSFPFQDLDVVKEMVENLDFDLMKNIPCFESGHHSTDKCHLDIYGSDNSPSVQIQIRMSRTLYNELHEQHDDFLKPKKVIIHSSKHMIKQHFDE